MLEWIVILATVFLFPFFICFGGAAIDRKAGNLGVGCMGIVTLIGGSFFAFLDWIAPKSEIASIIALIAIAVSGIAIGQLLGRLVNRRLIQRNSQTP